MEKVLNFIKNSKIVLAIIIVIFILVLIGVFFLSDNKKKEYELTEISNYRYFVLKVDNKYGVINETGNTIIEPIYDNVKIPNPEKSIFICEKDGSIITLNENKKELFTEFEEINAISIKGIVSNVPYEKSVLKYKKDGMYGLINFEGKIITKPVYDEISGLQNKESELLVKKDGKYGVINVKGATIIKAQYDSIVADGFYTEEDKYEKSGYIVCNKNSEGYRYGYISYKRKNILETSYNSVERVPIKNDKICLIACKNGKYGVIIDGKVIIDFAYQGIEYETDSNYFIVQRNKKYGVMDLNGKVLIPVEFYDIVPQGQYIRVNLDESSKLKYFDLDGNEVEDKMYTYIKKINENYFITANEDGIYGIVDNDKMELIENKYNYIEYLFENYFIALNDNGLIGVINDKDEPIIDFKYEELQRIDGTYVIEATLLKEGKTEIYSRNLEKIYSGKETSIYCEDTYLKLTTNKGTTYLDFDGIEISASDIFKNNNLLADKNSNKWGFIDRNKNVIVNYTYDYVTEFNRYGFAGIMLKNKWGVIDSNGNIVIKPTYNDELFISEPEFLGEYYKVYYDNGESYYTNM